MRRARFVAGRDHADARLVTKRDDGPGHVYASDTEYSFNAFPYKRLNEGFAPHSS